MVAVLGGRGGRGGDSAGFEPAMPAHRSAASLATPRGWMLTLAIVRRRAGPGACSACNAHLAVWASTIHHGRHVRDRSRSRCRIVKAEYPHGQPEFGRQFLDRAGTPTGQHRLQITSPRLHGHKMPGIAVGAVNHPLCASGHFNYLVLAICLGR